MRPREFPAGKPVLPPAECQAGAAEPEALRRLKDIWAKTGKEDCWTFLRWATEWTGPDGITKHGLVIVPDEHPLGVR